MENTKKMILIEPEVIEKLKNGNNNNNITRKFIIGKDRKPLEIPIVSYDEPENKRKEHVKLEPTSDVKQTLTTEDSTGVGEYYVKSQLLQFIPKSYRQKGELLLDILLKNKEKLRWGHQGTVFIHNKEVHKSNIVDLFNDVMRPLKHSSPRGWTEFAKALKELGVPLSYIGNPRRATFINVMSKTPDYENSFKTATPTNEELNFTPKNTNSHSSDSDTIGKQKVKRKIDWKKWTPY